MPYIVTSSVCNLTYDTLEYIFSFLPLKSRYIVEQVCRDWRNASILGIYLIKTLIIYHTQYINTIITRHFAMVQCKNSLTNTTCFMRNLKKLKIKNDNVLEIISTNCKNITYLDISTKTPEILCNFFINGNKLQYVKLKIPYNAEKNYKTGFISISNCINLKYIILNTHLICFTSLLECSLLEFIEIISPLHDKDFKDISIKCPKLKHLDISGDNITDIGYEYISKCSLECLILNTCNITNIGLNYIFIGCTKLKKFYISTYCEHTIDIGFKLIPACIEYIKLDLCDITNVGLRYIFERCNLKKITIRGCYKLTDKVFRHINCIESIKLSHLNITDLGLLYIFNKCYENLKFINISFCDDITDNGFKYIPNCIENITLLKLNITNITFKYIFNKFTMLKQITLGYCCNITREGLDYVMNRGKEFKCNMDKDYIMVTVIL